MRTAFHLLIVLLAVQVGLSVGSAEARRRLALSVGVDLYDHMPSDRQLKKAVNDARAMVAAFTELGFDATVAENPSRAEFLDAWEKLLKRLQPGDTAAFFFAGHGVEIRGTNYLLPRDVPKMEQTSEKRLAGASIRFNDLMDELREKEVRVSLLILDACRDNPIRDAKRRSVGGTRGLSAIVPPASTFVMYSAGVGESALDRLSDTDPNPNSVYTRALLPILRTPGLSLPEIAVRVRAEVIRLARGASHTQIPAYYDQLVDSVVLRPGREPVPKLSPPPAPPGDLERAWAAAKNSTSIAVLEDFRLEYGHKDQFYDRLAEARIAELKKREVPPASANDLYKNLDLFGDVLERVRSDYVEPPDDASLMAAAIEGMLRKFPSQSAREIAMNAGLNRKTARASPGDSGIYRFLDVFGDVLDKIASEYGKSWSGAMVQLAIEHMLHSLDPHSAYLSPKALQDMQAQAKAGIGAELTMEAGTGILKVVSPLDEGPAAKAGLMTGDVIARVDGARIAGVTLGSASEKMRGPAKTPVVLTIMRPGKDTPFELKVVRDAVPVDAVRTRLLGDVVYVRIATFNENAHASLVQQVAGLKRLLGRPPRGYIVDLRSNAGGLLDQAIGVADEFLDKGSIVLTKGRTPQDTTRSNARAGDIAEGKPIVVLINGGSAYAPEIVGAALQDHKRAILVGARSFGMGLVQTIIPLGKAGGALKLTTARHYTPIGKGIDGKGVAPDIEVPQELPLELRGTDSSSYVPRDSDRDAQLQYALKMLRGEPLPPLGLGR